MIYLEYVLTDAFDLRGKGLILLVYYVLEVVECRYRYYVFELVVIFPNLENCFGNFSHKSLN